MPLLHLTTSVEVPESIQSKLLPELSRIVADCIGKPEQYVMISVQRQPILMGGKPGPAAWVDLRSIGGLNTEVNNLLAQKLSYALGQHLNIKADRIFILFTDVQAANWAWKGETFG